MYPENILFTQSKPVIAKVVRIDEYPYHWHSAVEIILVLEGAAEVTLCGENHLLVEIQIAMVNVDEPHRIKKNGRTNRMLLSMDEFIYEILTKCGFSDSKYFIKYFKFFSGYTPSDFRKRARCRTANFISYDRRTKK